MKSLLVWRVDKLMKNTNVKTGKLGEKAAEKFLKKKKYKILKRNFRTRFGEIDLIVKFLNTIIFVEVKTKTGDRFGEPWEMIDKRKLEQVKKMGQVYLTEKGLSETACRIDVIGVWLEQGTDEVEKIEHWEDVQL